MSWKLAFIFVSVLTLAFVAPATAKDFSAVADVGNGADKTVVLDFNINEGETGEHLIFAIGPALKDEGFENVAEDPKLTLYKDGSQLDSVDNWQDHPSAEAVAEITELGGKLPDEKEAAMVLDLQAGVYQIVAENGVDSFGKVRVGVTKDVVNAGKTPGPPGSIVPGLWSGSDDKFEGCLNVSADGKQITLISSSCIGPGQDDIDAINIQINQWDDPGCGDDSGYIDWSQNVPIIDGAFEIVDNSAQPWFPLTIRVEGFFFDGLVFGTITKTLFGATCQGSFELTPVGN